MGRAEPRVSASDRAYGWTKDQILSGALGGGSMISEGIVSDAIGVSRTPVREAFLRLAAEGFLTLHPKRGALVVPVSVADVHDVLEARLLVEPWAVEVALRAGHVDALAAALDAQLAALADALDAGDGARFQAADRAFHEAVVGATGNALVEGFYSTLRDRQLRIGAMTTSPERSSTILREHEQIARALRRGDAAKAGALVTKHIEGTRRTLLLAPRPASAAASGASPRPA